MLKVAVKADFFISNAIFRNVVTFPVSKLRAFPRNLAEFGHPINSP